MPENGSEETWESPLDRLSGSALSAPRAAPWDVRNEPTTSSKADRT